MTEDRKYWIRAEMTPKPEWIPPKAMLVIEGLVTEEEYRALFGPDRRIQKDMCLTTWDPSDYYSINVFLEQVSQEDSYGNESHQYALAISLMKAEGRAVPEGEEFVEWAAGADDLSPETVKLMLHCADEGRTVWDARPPRYRAVAGEMLAAGLTWRDLVKPEWIAEIEEKYPIPEKEQDNGNRIN